MRGGSWARQAGLFGLGRGSLGKLTSLEARAGPAQGRRVGMLASRTEGTLRLLSRAGWQAVGQRWAHRETGSRAEPGLGGRAAEQDGSALALVVVAVRDQTPEQRVHL